MSISIPKLTRCSSSKILSLSKERLIQLRTIFYLSQGGACQLEIIAAIMTCPDCWNKAIALAENLSSPITIGQFLEIDPAIHHPSHLPRVREHLALATFSPYKISTQTHVKRDKSLDKLRSLNPQRGGAGPKIVRPSKKSKRS